MPSSLIPRSLKDGGSAPGERGYVAQHRLAAIAVTGGLYWAQTCKIPRSLFTTERGKCFAFDILGK